MWWRLFLVAFSNVIYYEHQLKVLPQGVKYDEKIAVIKAKMLFCNTFII